MKRAQEAVYKANEEVASHAEAWIETRAWFA